MRYLFLLFWLLPSLLPAQITLTGPDLGWTLNSLGLVRTVDSNYLAGLDLQATGGGQVWDFSAIPITGRIDTLFFVIPDETAWTAGFPLANLATLTEPGNPLAAASYYLLTDTSLAFLGYQDTVSRTVPLEPDLRLTFPFTAGSTIDQSFRIFRDLAAFTDTGTVAQQISVDAWGEIILPLGRFPCLRLKRTREEQFEVFGLPVLIKNTIYEFWADRFFGPLLTIDFQQSFLFGGVDESWTGQLIQWDFAYANRTLHPDVYQMLVFPNPAHNRLEVEYSLRENSMVQLEIYDATGRSLRRFDLGRQPTGAHRQPVDLRGLAPGVYQIVLQGKAGRSARQVVVE